MLIQVDGWFGSGKSVLWSLLDGHPEVFCSPIHDYAYATFLSHDNSEEWIRTKHIELLRKTMLRTQYYKFEKIHLDGFYGFFFSGGDLAKLPIEYDYYKFNKLFGKTMHNATKWDLEMIIDTFYECVRQTTSYATKPKPKYYASMSYAAIADQYERFPTKFPHAKSIQVRRPVEHIIATRSNRKPMPADSKTKLVCKDFQKWIEEGEVEKICEFHNIHDDLEKKYPEQFMKVDFFELINNTEKVMPKVAEFLEIDMHPILLKGTYNSKEIIHDGQKYVGKVLDNIKELLAEDEIALIQERIRKYEKNRNT